MTNRFRNRETWPGKERHTGIAQVMPNTSSSPKLLSEGKAYSKLCQIQVVQSYCPKSKTSNIDADLSDTAIDS